MYFSNKLYISYYSCRLTAGGSTGMEKLWLGITAFLAGIAGMRDETTDTAAYVFNVTL